MDKQRMIEIKNELGKMRPNELDIKELHYHLNGDGNKQPGLMVQDIIVRLLEYYIDKEFGKDSEVIGNNVYVITEIGGEYDERYEQVISVYSDENKCKEEVDILNKSINDDNVHEYTYTDVPFN